MHGGFIMFARQISLRLIYQGKNVTDELQADILDFTYTDNSHGEADEIALTLKDETFKYLGDWHPTLGDKMQPTIIMNDGRELSCGSFKLDDFEDSGPPTRVIFSAVSVPNDKSVRQTKNTKAWQDVRLKKVIQDTADKAKLTLTYATEVNPTYDRIDQKSETDLGFLKRICEDEGLSLKVTDSQVVVFDREELEKKPSVSIIDRFGGQVSRWSCKTQNHDTASETTVEYKDPKTGKKISHTEKAKKENGGNKQKITKRVKSKAQAERVAKAKQKEKQGQETTISITVIGDVDYRAGANVTIKNYGKFDGKYFIKKATHSMPKYTVALELSKNAN